MGTIKLTSDKGKKYEIDEKNEIARGGEGRIIAIPKDKTIVAKIYHQGISPLSNEQYLFLNKLDKNLFVIPLELLLYADGSTAGFVMEFLSDDFFPLSAIFTKNFCARNGITEKQKHKVAEKLIEAVRYAHQQQVVIGDLNQYNVLINQNADIRLIDVDSYQTPNHLHSGLLLEEIRDYLYGGSVSLKSDFYALSVLLFSSITYSHPFKGVHKLYKNLAERIKHRIPVFANDPDLIAPKCYQPLTQDNLQKQFERLYIKGERFMISLSGISDISSRQVQVAQITDKLVRKNLSILPILSNTNIYDMVFSETRGYIETNELFIVYNAQNKGYLASEFTIKKTLADRVYLGNKHTILLKNNKLYHYQNSNSIIEICNPELPKEAIFQQFENILLIVGNDLMYHVYLDEIINTSIMNKRTEVFSLGFRWHTGLVQSTGGVNRIFYHAGKDLANVKIDANVKQINQQQNVAMVQYIENKEVKNRYVKIDGLKPVFAPLFSDRFTEFAYMPKTKTDGFIFEANDNRINVISTTNFQKVSEIECEFITEHSKIQFTKAGILVTENGNVYLLNVIGK